MMRKIILAITVFSALILNTLLLSATVRLPSILGNHMVLQQNSEVKLWGWCDPEEVITIKTNWDTLTYKTAGEPSAKWSQKIKTPSAIRLFPTCSAKKGCLSTCSEPITGRWIP